MGSEKAEIRPRKKKVLFVATVDSHILHFHIPYLKMFHDKGWEVHVATNGKEKIPYCDKKHTLPMERSPFSFKNLKAIKQMRKLVKDEHFDIIHCHTPMGSVVTRLAAKKVRKSGTRVIYTAHGFHFYKGAPLLNWMLYYPVEKYLAKYTDTLITINQEDYDRAKRKFSKRCWDIQYVPGVGIDPKKFEKKLNTKQKHELRASLGLKDDDVVLICAGRLDKNKNQGLIIKAMKELVAENSKYHLLLAGADELGGEYQKLAKKLGVSSNVHFLGFCDNVAELMQISDIAVSASKREGLPMNLVEAAYIGLPIVATDCRGNRDVCTKTGGVAINCNDHHIFAASINNEIAPSNIHNEFLYTNIEQKMKTIYNSFSSKKETFPIDFVILWVDGSDPEWIKKRAAYMKNAKNTNNNDVRYRDWGTLKYWFRSVEKYAPWVNHVYLVTDNQKPEWINENCPKLTIVDHKAIMEPKILPTFNSQAIEMNLHKIPGLSEHFVYFNDDIFINAKTKPKDFFKKGLPIEIANINAATGMEGDQLYAQTMFNDILLINRNFKKKDVIGKHPFKWINIKYGSFNIRTLTQIAYPFFTGYKPHHISSSFLKSTFDTVWERENSTLKNTCAHRFRDCEDVNQNVFTLWQICSNNFSVGPKRRGKHLTLRSLSNVPKIKRTILSSKNKLICINDGLPGDTSDKDICKIRKELLSVFENKYSEKSRYEK